MSRSRRGRRSRDKGTSFERLVANAIRAHAPSAVVRRGKQSHLADEGDVVVEIDGHPLARLWIECNHSSKESIATKLAQAEADCAKWDRWVNDQRMVPVVVWRRTGSPSVNVTCRFAALVALINLSSTVEFTSAADSATVTLSLADFLGGFA